MCRYPFGSGGKRVTTFVWRLAARSAAMISRMKSRPVFVSATAVSVMLHHPLKAAAYVPNPRARAKTLRRKTFDDLCDFCATRTSVGAHLRLTRPQWPRVAPLATVKQSQL